MVTFDVTKVRKEKSGAGNTTHEHIVGVITAAGAFSTNRQVVDSINAGNMWQTSVPGEPKARIRELRLCPHAACTHSPYLTTHPDHTQKNNLENLPRG